MQSVHPFRTRSCPPPPPPPSALPIALPSVVLLSRPAPASSFLSGRCASIPYLLRSPPLLSLALVHAQLLDRLPASISGGVEQCGLGPSALAGVARHLTTTSRPPLTPLPPPRALVHSQLLDRLPASISGGVEQWGLGPSALAGVARHLKDDLASASANCTRTDLHPSVRMSRRLLFAVLDASGDGKVARDEFMFLCDVLSLRFKQVALVTPSTQRPAPCPPLAPAPRPSASAR
jgi:hypothetical protein